MVTGKSNCSTTHLFGVAVDLGLFVLLCTAIAKHSTKITTDHYRRRKADIKVLNSFRDLQSLFWSHGSRWLLFRVGYALRKRTGYIRLQLPAYQWSDRPLKTWLKKDVPATPEAYIQWRKHHSPKFFNLRAERSDSVDEAHISSNIPWNPKHAINEAERILKGELKYFDHRFIQTGFPPDWHKDPVSGQRM